MGLADSLTIKKKVAIPPNAVLSGKFQLAKISEARTKKPTVICPA